MSDDDLVKRLRDSTGYWPWAAQEAADRIEELEAKLAEAVKAAYCEGFVDGAADGWVNNPNIEKEWRLSATLAKLKAGKAKT